MTSTDLASIAARVLPLLDLTSLGADDTPADIERLCAAASTPAGPVASVCIWPRFVAQAVDLLAGTGIPVAAVANFPEGDDDDERAVADAVPIVEAGGAEVDVVVPWRRLAAGDEAPVAPLVGAVRAAVGPDIVVKAILETGELAEASLVARAGHLALDGGADFLKASTGKTEHSATPEAARTLLEVRCQRAGPDGPAGVKISGVVGTTEQAAVYLDLADEAFGADRVSGARPRVGDPVDLGRPRNIDSAKTTGRCR